MNMKPEYAWVRFLDETDKNYYVPINYIKFNKNDSCSIMPKDCDDFNERHIYYIRWCLCKTSTWFNNCDSVYYKAIIILLSESEDSAKEKMKLKQNRIKIPKLLDSSDSDSDTPTIKEQPLQKKKKIWTENAKKENLIKITSKYKQKNLLEKRKSFISQSSEIGNSTNELEINLSAPASLPEIVESTSKELSVVIEPITNFSVSKSNRQNNVLPPEIRPPVANRPSSPALSDSDDRLDIPIDEGNSENQENNILANAAVNEDTNNDASDDNGLPLLKFYKKKLYKRYKNQKNMPEFHETRRRYESFDNDSKIYLGLGIYVGTATWHLMKRKKKKYSLEN